MIAAEYHDLPTRSGFTLAAHAVERLTAADYVLLEQLEWAGYGISLSALSAYHTACPGRCRVSR
jgi:hypothetical protein